MTEGNKKPPPSPYMRTGTHLQFSNTDSKTTKLESVNVCVIVHYSLTIDIGACFRFKVSAV